MQGGILDRSGAVKIDMAILLIKHVYYDIKHTRDLRTLLNSAKGNMQCSEMVCVGIEKKYLRSGIFTETSTGTTGWGWWSGSWVGLT